MNLPGDLGGSVVREPTRTLDRCQLHFIVKKQGSVAAAVVRGGKELRDANCEEWYPFKNRFLFGTVFDDFFLLIRRNRLESRFFVPNMLATFVRS